MAKIYDKICVFCAKPVSYSHGTKPKVCPYCGKADYIKPPTETKLFLLQKAFIETKDEKYLGQLYVLLKAYTKSIIKKMVPSNFKYDEDFIEEKASDAANIMIEKYYLSNEVYSIDVSFGGYIKHRVREVLYLKKREEMHESLNAPVLDSEKELIDYSERNNMKSLFIKEEQDPANKLVSNVINDIDELIDKSTNIIANEYGTKDSILTLIMVNNLVNKKLSDSDQSSFYTYFGQNIKKHSDNVMYLLYVLLKEYSQVRP